MELPSCLAFCVDISITTNISGGDFTELTSLMPVN